MQIDPQKYKTRSESGFQAIFLADRTGLEPKSQSYFESISYKHDENCTHRITHYFKISLITANLHEDNIVLQLMNGYQGKTN